MTSTAHKIRNALLALPVAFAATAHAQENAKPPVIIVPYQDFDREQGAPHGTVASIQCEGSKTAAIVLVEQVEIGELAVNTIRAELRAQRTNEIGNTAKDKVGSFFVAADNSFIDAERNGYTEARKIAGTFNQDPRDIPLKDLHAFAATFCSGDEAQNKTAAPVRTAAVKSVYGRKPG